MTDDFDDNAVFGEATLYVPCDEVASAFPAPDDDENAITGRNGGYVPPGTGAAAFPVSELDDNAVYGTAVGFVAKPCEQFADAIPGLLQNIANSSYHKQIRRVTGSTTFEDGPPGDTVTNFGTIAGTGLHTHYRPGFFSPDERWEVEGRAYFAHDQPFPDNNYGRLRARLVSGAFYDLGGSPVPVDWVIAQASLGGLGSTADPDWDTSTGGVLASGTLAENPQGGPFANYVDIDIWIPVVSGRVEWALLMGPQPLLNGSLFQIGSTDAVIVPRYPDIGPPAPAVSSPSSWGAFDGWALDRGTAGPTDTSSFVIDDYWLQWYTVP